MIRRGIAGCLGLALLLSLPAAATPAAAREILASCPRVLFLGMHGMEEGSANTQPGERSWGRTIEAVWKEFDRSAVAEAEAVSYNRTDTWNLPVIHSATKVAANALTQRLRRVQQECSAQTKVVISGYSQGAWAVDMALRTLISDEPTLANVKGVFLMGDPAWPVQTIRESKLGHKIRRYGIATGVGLGYPSEAAYRNNGIGDAFFSICIHPSSLSPYYDPVCLGNTRVGFHGFGVALKSHLLYTYNAEFAAKFLTSKVGTGVG